MFGAHITSTPEPEEAATAGASPYARWGLIGLALLLVLGVGWVAVNMFGTDDVAAATLHAVRHHHRHPDRRPGDGRPRRPGRGCPR